MFYQKEKKIQIFLKNENYTAARKRRASSESVDSEAVRSSPVKKIKIKKIKKDPQTSSVGSAEKKLKRSSMSPRSVTVTVTGPSSSPASSPQLSPTKCLQGGAGKKVPIYHNAHKIFRAQQMIARQMKTSSEPEPPLGSPGSCRPVGPPPLQSKTLSEAAKLNSSSSLVTQYVQPSQPPCLSPQQAPMQPLQSLQPLQPLHPLPKYQPDPHPPLLQPVQKGGRFVSVQQMFSLSTCSCFRASRSQ